MPFPDLVSEMHLRVFSSLVAGPHANSPVEIVKVQGRDGRNTTWIPESLDDEKLQ
jgi:hypothetical protein